MITEQAAAFITPIKEWMPVKDLMEQKGNAGRRRKLPFSQMCLVRPYSRFMIPRQI